MRYDWIDEYLLAKKGASKDFKEEWNWIRYKINDKLFCAVCLDDNLKPYFITLKLEPLEGEFYREKYEDIIPGFYMNKTHWNSVRVDGTVQDDVLRELLDKSYKLILASFSKKRQKEILGE